MNKTMKKSGVELVKVDIVNLKRFIFRVDIIFQYLNLVIFVCEKVCTSG